MEAVADHPFPVHLATYKSTKWGGRGNVDPTHAPFSVVMRGCVSPSAETSMSLAGLCITNPDCAVQKCLHTCLKIKHVHWHPYSHLVTPPSEESAEKPACMCNLRTCVLATSEGGALAWDASPWAKFACVK